MSSNDRVNSNAFGCSRTAVAEGGETAQTDAPIVNADATIGVTRTTIDALTVIR